MFKILKSTIGNDVANKIIASLNWAENYRYGSVFDGYCQDYENDENNRRTLIFSEYDILPDCENMSENIEKMVENVIKSYFLGDNEIEFYYKVAEFIASSTYHGYIENDDSNNNLTIYRKKYIIAVRNFNDCHHVSYKGNGVYSAFTKFIVMFPAFRGERVFFNNEFLDQHGPLRNRHCGISLVIDAENTNYISEERFNNIINNDKISLFIKEF